AVGDGRRGLAWRRVPDDRDPWVDYRYDLVHSAGSRRLYDGLRQRQRHLLDGAVGLIRRFASSERAPRKRGLFFGSRVKGAALTKLACSLRHSSAQRGCRFATGELGAMVRIARGFTLI